MTAHRPHDATSQVFDLRGPGSTAGGRQRRKGRWSAPIVLLASAVGSCIMLTWYQIMTLHSLQNERHVEGLPASAPLDQIKFISVVGLYHTVSDLPLLTIYSTRFQRQCKPTPCSAVDALLIVWQIDRARQ